MYVLGGMYACSDSAGAITVDTVAPVQSVAKPELPMIIAAPALDGRVVLRFQGAIMRSKDHKTEQKVPGQCFQHLEIFSLQRPCLQPYSPLEVPRQGFLYLTLDLYCCLTRRAHECEDPATIATAVPPLAQVAAPVAPLRDTSSESMPSSSRADAIFVLMSD